MKQYRNIHGMGKPLVNRFRKINRNDLCPCGSGKKVKHCHIESLDKKKYLVKK